MKQFLLIYIICFILVYSGYAEGDFAKDLFVCGMSSLTFSLTIFGVYYIFKKTNDDIKKMTPEELKQHKQQFNIEIKDRNAKHYYSEKIIQTIILEQNYKTKTRLLDMAGRASIGHSLFGDVGAAIGAMTSEPKVIPKKIKFLIIYEDGHRRTETVKYNSRRYNELIMYI